MVGLHPHELRHTAESLAIVSAANVKGVQQMLGHQSATKALDLYGHSFPTSSTRWPALDAVRAESARAQVVATGLLL